MGRAERRRASRSRAKAGSPGPVPRAVPLANQRPVPRSAVKTPAPIARAEKAPAPVATWPLPARDWRVPLADAVARRNALERQVDQLACRALAEGATYADVGKLLGISRQAARMRYRPTSE